MKEHAVGEDRSRLRVVVVGGGFGGLSTVRALRGMPVDITLIDRVNHHLFQPLLYQVATGILSPANIAAPLRGLLRSQRNVRVLLGEVSDVDLNARVVRDEGFEVPYDILVVATGARLDYFGSDWSTVAPGLKTVADATEIRRRILGAFEAAEVSATDEETAVWLTFVVVGAARPAWNSLAPSQRSPVTRSAASSGGSIRRVRASFSWRAGSACSHSIRAHSPLVLVVRCNASASRCSSGHVSPTSRRTE